jgi:hypothetical protein
LGDGAVNAPAGPHFAPVEDEPLPDRREFIHIGLLFLYKQKIEKIDVVVKPKFIE